jgi:hypothetical protein
VLLHLFRKEFIDYRRKEELNKIIAEMKITDISPLSREIRVCVSGVV